MALIEARMVYAPGKRMTVIPEWLQLV